MLILCLEYSRLVRHMNQINSTYPRYLEIKYSCAPGRPSSVGRAGAGGRGGSGRRARVDRAAATVHSDRLRSLPSLVRSSEKASCSLLLGDKKEQEISRLFFPLREEQEEQQPENCYGQTSLPFLVRASAHFDEQILQ